MYTWLKGLAGERLAFAAMIYLWMLTTFAAVAVTYLGLYAVAYLTRLPLLESTAAKVFFVIGATWISTLLHVRGFRGFTWVSEPIRGVYMLAQQGLLPPLMRKVNQFKVPLLLITFQGILTTFWALFLAWTGEGIRIQPTMVVIVSSLFLLLILALPFWLYARHNKAKHKTIVLPSLTKPRGNKRSTLILPRFRAKYQIHPAPEDYLPFSWRKKLMREHHEGIAAYKKAEEQGVHQASSESPAETVVEADEIEYTN